MVWVHELKEIPNTFLRFLCDFSIDQDWCKFAIAEFQPLTQMDYFHKDEDGMVISFSRMEHQDRLIK